MEHTLETLQAQYEYDTEVLLERLDALELALEDSGWRKLSGEADRDFSREGLRKIARLSRLMFLKNPLIQRGVKVQSHYVFGQGVVFTAEDPEVNKVIQRFVKDEANQAELTSHQAMLDKGIELHVDGNIFLVRFSNPATGLVKTRTIPFDEVADIICNPDDSKEPWFYYRVWSVNQLDMAKGTTTFVERKAYYPDWNYHPATQPPSMGEKPIYWDKPVYHLKVGGLPGMKFGVPETYAALDWAKAYKAFLEDWSTIVRSYARFAWQITTKRASGVKGVKAKLNTTLSPDRHEGNPPPIAGSAFVGTDGTNVAPIRTAGATTSAEDGRRLLLMVAACMGLPETFFGDVSVGTLATARSMDRPTELQFVSRQTLWETVFKKVLDYVVKFNVQVGRLEGFILEDGTVDLGVDEFGNLRSSAVRVEFPPILEHDLSETVGAIVDAATLRGNTSAGLIDNKTVSRLLLTALGVDGIEDALKQIYPEGEETSGPVLPAVVERALGRLLAELRDLREGLEVDPTNG